MPVVNQCSLRSKKVAILAGNGFCESDMGAVQKALQDTGAYARIISSEQGLVCGWNGAGWGHHFAIDSNVRTALAADFDCLVVPGGQKSVEKLRLTAHTRRFVSSFISANKPVAFFGDAIQLLPHCVDIAGRSVTGPAALEAALLQEGAVWAGTPLHLDTNLLTGDTAAEGAREKMIDAMLGFFANHKTGLLEGETASVDIAA